MVQPNFIQKATLVLSLLLVGGTFHRMFGGNIAATRLQELYVNLHFSIGLEQLAILSFITASVCLTLALILNPSILKRSNIRRG